MAEQKNNVYDPMMEIASFGLRWIPSWHVARRLVVLVGIAVVYSAIVALIIQALDKPTWSAGTEWATINGLILGVLLVFRNKEAYERWWEGRKLWGQLINETRNLALKIKSFVQLSAAERVEVERLLKGFAHALKCHLRGDEDLHHVPGFEKEIDRTDHLPLNLAGRLFDSLASWQRDGRITGETLWVLDSHARALMDICGACERIRTSPVPYSYRALLRHGVLLYMMLAPWSFILENGYWGIAIVAVVFYFLLGIELIAEDVEEPFGLDPDDLPLDRMCETIRLSVAEVLNEPAP
jgi:ion channel-forming bestrophin family protein